MFLNSPSTRLSELLIPGQASQVASLKQSTIETTPATLTRHHKVVATSPKLGRGF
jgi:hypothetical protein